MRLGFRTQNWVLQKNGKYHTLLGTNISPPKGTFEDDFPIPMVGYVSSLENISTINEFLLKSSRSVSLF